MSGAKLICPLDRSNLVVRAGAYVCESCGSSYESVGGVVRFLKTTDAFYEGVYLNKIHFVPKSERLHRVWPAWLINNGYLWRVRNNVPAGSTVLELGCAGGVAYFAQRYHMIGLDVSMASLQSAATHYQTCVQADAADFIPLADGSVDAVASSFFWEHIPPDTKRRMLKEIRRVLRPHGRLIFLYDVETLNPLVSAMRRSSPSLYNAEFIERDGHLGYQPPEENVATFESEGFRVIENLGLERTPLQSTTVYSKMRKWPQPFSAIGSVLSLIDRSRASFFGYIGLLRAVDETLGKVLPQRWSRMALTVCEKA